MFLVTVCYVAKLTYLERHASSPHKSRGDDNTRANTAHHPVRSVSALATLGQQTRGARRNCRVSHPHTVRRRSSPPIAARFSFVRMATGAPRRVMRVGIRLYSGQERTGLKSLIRPQVRGSPHHFITLRSSHHHHDHVYRAVHPAARALQRQYHIILHS